MNPDSAAVAAHETATDAPRLPLYAAGPGNPDTALHLLLAAGWALYEDEVANKTLISPDGQLACEFGPETSRYARNPRTALWQITFTHPNPYTNLTWTAQFGDQVPAEAITAFLSALIDPTALPADRDA